MGQVWHAARRNREGVSQQKQAFRLPREFAHMLRCVLLVNRPLQAYGGRAQLCLQGMLRQCQHLAFRARRKFLHFSVLDCADDRHVLDRAGVVNRDIIEQLPELPGFRFRGHGTCMCSADRAAKEKCEGNKPTPDGGIHSEVLYSYWVRLAFNTM